MTPLKNEKFPKKMNTKPLFPEAQWGSMKGGLPVWMGLSVWRSNWEPGLDPDGSIRGDQWYCPLAGPKPRGVQIPNPPPPKWDC